MKITVHIPNNLAAKAELELEKYTTTTVDPNTGVLTTTRTYPELSAWIGDAVRREIKRLVPISTARQETLLAEIAERQAELASIEPAVTTDNPTAD
jgi:hypothetical protein